MAGVHVTLSSVPKFPDASQPYGATSGADGRFSIPGLPSGVYTLSPRHNGFLYLQDENRDFTNIRIALKQGDAITDRVVEMTPIAIISGRVVDEYGDPVENVFARASLPGVDSGMSPVLSRMNARTDERGRFRITGAPGKFRIAATGGGPGRGAREVRTDGSEVPVYAETWYPSADSQDRATLVDAVAGRETAGIDIRLVRKRSFTISGIVTGTPKGLTRAELIVHTRFFGLPATPRPDADGNFTLAGLPADRYTVYARYQSGAVLLTSAPVEVRLETANATNLNLELAPPEEVSGTVEFEGARVPHQRPVVRLETVVPGHFVETQGGNVDDESRFSLTSVSRVSIV